MNYINVNESFCQDQDREKLYFLRPRGVSAAVVNESDGVLLTGVANNKRGKCPDNTVTAVFQFYIAPNKTTKYRHVRPTLIESVKNS